MHDATPFVDFYDAIGFAPTRRSEMFESFEVSRSFLYRELGLPDLAIPGRTIVEFGPGSGDNAERLLSLGPRSYTFADGSRAVLDGLVQRFPSSHYAEKVPIRIEMADFSALDLREQFDIVICEGVLPLQLDPVGMAHKVLAHARNGGVAILTCMDAVSGFSEVCRRYIAHVTFGVDGSILGPESASDLVEFFAADFDALPGMTRRREDWVLDSIVNPWIGKFFSIEDALSVDPTRFALLGSSPRVLQDWRWYKDPTVCDSAHSAGVAIESFRRISHNFLDVREPLGPKSAETNRRLHHLCAQVALRVREHVQGQRHYSGNEFGSDVREIVVAVDPAATKTLEALTALEEWAHSQNPSDLSSFRAMWGRGQQYLSLVRVKQ